MVVKNGLVKQLIDASPPNSRYKGACWQLCRHINAKLWGGMVGG